MKKIVVLTLASFLLLSHLKSQNADNGRRDAVMPGDNTINLYYGTNLLGSVYKRIFALTGTNFQVKSIGPIGIVYEHLLTNVIGLGGEFGYSQTNVDFEASETYYGSNGQPYNEVFNYRWEFRTIRAMLRVNFHFAQMEKFDAYGLMSVGYRTTNHSVYTNDPQGSIRYKFNAPFPMGFKPGLGLRYFFTPNVGLNLEMALGTPLLCGGLSFKF